MPQCQCKKFACSSDEFRSCLFDVDVFFIAETRGSLNLDFYMFGGKHG